MQYQSLGRRGGESKVCADAGYIVYRETLLIFLMAGNRCDWRLSLLWRGTSAADHWKNGANGVSRISTISVWQRVNAT